MAAVDQSPMADGSRLQERLWPLRLWAVVAAFVAVAVVRSVQVGVPFRDPGGEFLRLRVVVTVAVFAVLVVLDALRRLPRGARSPRSMVASVRERWTPRRLLLAAGALAAYHATYVTYHNLKSWNSFNTVRDHLLESVDRWLFLGHSPASLLHDLLGQHAAAWVLVVVYEAFPTLVTVAFVAPVVLVDDMREAWVAMAAFCWVWILGTATYYLIPSLGPFHEAPQDFAGLPHTVVTTTQARYMAQRADLLAHPSAPGAFAQVAAFASLHIGVSTVILLVVRYFGQRRATIAMTVYVVATAVATVYLGWHFFVDDVAGVVIAVLALLLGSMTINGRLALRRATV